MSSVKCSSGSSAQVPVGYCSKPPAMRYPSGTLGGTSAWHLAVSTCLQAVLPLCWAVLPLGTLMFFFESSSGISGQVPVRYRSKPAVKRYSSGTWAGTSAWYLVVSLDLQAVVPAWYRWGSAQNRLRSGTQAVPGPVLPLESYAIEFFIKRYFHSAQRYYRLGLDILFGYFFIFGD